MKKAMLALVFVLTTVSAFAGTRPPHRPHPGQHQQQQDHGQYDQGQHQQGPYQQQQTGGYSQHREEYRTDYRGQNRQSYDHGQYSQYSQHTQYHPAPRPSCPQRCAPPRPAPRPDCMVIMIDACDREVYRYNGYADRPSGQCAGALRQCSRDVQREGQYGARCVQTRR